MSDRYVCGVCGASYARISHLHRHEVTHSGERNCLCEFCDRSFFRIDIARRHAQNCPARGDKQHPVQQKRGKKRKACDACAKARIACDAAELCENCLAYGISCTYNRVNEDTAAAATTRQKLTHDVSFVRLDDDPVVIQQTPEASTQGVFEFLNWGTAQNTTDDDRNRRFPFLMNFTRNQRRTMRMLFNGYTDAGLSPSSDDTVLYAGDGESDLSLELKDDWSNLFDNILFDADSLSRLSDDSFGSMSEVPRADLRYLQTGSMITADTIDRDGPVNCRPQVISGSRTHEIIDTICRTALLTVEYSSSKFDQISANAQYIFTADNVSQSITSYFHYFHPHVSLLHMPTFNGMRIILPLLINVTLMGSLYSSTTEISRAACALLDVAEEYTFSHPCCVELIGARRVKETVECVEILQAMYLICSMQCFNGTCETQRNIRRRRFNDVISALRALSLTTAMNEYSHQLKSVDNFDWAAFINKELKIRAATHIFLLDCEFAIFHNVPSRISVREMTGDVTCSDDAFDAPTADECYHALVDHDVGRLSLASTIKMLCSSGVEDADVIERFHNLSVLNCFLLINTLNAQIFVSNVMLLTSSMNSIDLALDRWILIWSHVVSHLSVPQRRRLGFTRSSHEYWELGKKAAGLIMQKEEEGKPESAASPVDVDDSFHIGEILAQVGGMRLS
ncbi:uncharacterized protein V1518DRAFT_418894 [Limtongia smithiae]|uniref:uncharacterized protein n=1 Tax=Limtongia smithiae TaxID=1125753 RepID=UPI0034CFDDBD